MNKTRTENVAKNVVLSTIFQLVAYILGFVGRTIFIKILGKEYLGLNGLFTNILTLLSFAELGIGSAIVYSMYKPLAIKDNTKLKQLINFYKKAYFYIGLIVVIGALAFAPFLDFFIKDAPDIKENLVVIYLLFAFNTAISYFFSYKTSILSADQKNYLIVVYTKTFKIIAIFVQIVVLYLTHNYYLYLIIELVATLITNILLYIKSNKLYPELRDTGDLTLPKEEKDSILTNIKSLVIYKVGGVALNGTDNLIISKYLGLVVGGVYSNYQLLVNAVTEIVGQVTNSFTASIGNLNSISSVEKKEEVFYKILYFTYLLFGVCSISLLIVLSDVVDIWLGKDFLLDFFTVSMIVGHFYVNGVQYASFSYRNTLGLFRQAKLGPLLATIINIVLSIVLAKKIGLGGVFLATIVARFLSYGIIDPIVVYKTEFKKSVLIYYKKYFKYLFFVAITFVVVYEITSIIPNSNLLYVMLEGIIAVTVSFLLLVLFTFKTKEYSGLKENFIQLFQKFKDKRKRTV